MKKIILATHGYMANGLKSALEIVTRDVSSLIAINAFTPDCENPEQEIIDILAQYPDDGDLLVLTDVFFGSVNQIFMRQMQRRNLKIVTGINLLLAMEVMSLLGQEPSDEELLEMIELCRKGMRLVTREEVERRLGSAAQDADEDL